MNERDTMMAAVRGIVVGYDATPCSLLALEWAAQTAARDDRPLTLLHCVDLNATAMFPTYDAATDTQAREDLADDLLGDGLTRAERYLGRDDITALRVLGGPAATLIEASERADLVVTGSRGHGRLHAGLLGSTAYAVTAHASCPAVVVRGVPEGPPIHAGPSHPVVVGLDDSKQALNALDVAAQVAAAAGARLRVVRVVSPSSEAAVFMREPGIAPPPTPDLRELAEQSVSAAQATVESAHPGLEVESEVRLGDPGHVLGELSEGAGLVVLGSHGHGGFVGMLLGSVSHRVIHDATCPVMVVR